MLKILKEETNGFATFICQGYCIDSAFISLNKIPLFILDFTIFLSSDKIREVYGYLYDITISTITLNDNNTCDITFVCRVSI